MDPRMYNAAMKGDMEDGDFSLGEHLRREEENGYQVTPNGNTILHVATIFGQRDFVREVLKITPGLLCYKNKKDETALHIAANVGQSEVVRELLSITGEKTALMRMTDDTGDTALHKAVRGGHLDIIKILVELLVDPDPKHDFPANKAGETPLYLAAESGFHDALIEILKVYKEPTYVAGPSTRTPLHAAVIQEHEGPSKRTPLHAAVIQEHKECARSLWQWNNRLCEVADEWGWNSLHYAVKQGLKDLVSDMLNWEKSLAYLPAGSANDWTTAFHIAASEGDILMIKELLDHCPDCWDMVDSNGQNALHVAILNHQEKLVNEFLKSRRFNSLVDEADNEGNTPLHLLSASWTRLPKLIFYHRRTRKMAFNKQNQTPFDIAYSRTWTIHKEKFVADLCSINGRLGQRDFNVNRKMKKMGNIQLMSKEDEQDKAKIKKLKIVKMRTAAQIQVVVAALVMTVTFTAGFTLPGGLKSGDGPNKGTAILLENTDFVGFVVSDVLAFLFSFEAIFLYHLMAHADVVIDNENALFQLLWCLYYVAAVFQVLAMASAAAAFGYGIGVTSERSPCLVVGIGVTTGAVFLILNSFFFLHGKEQKNLLFEKC